MKVNHIAGVGIMVLSLAACAGGPPAEPRTVIKEVQVVVPVRCKPDIGPTPVYPDSDAAIAAAPDIFAAAQLYRAGRLLRLPREAALLAALKECEG